MWINSQLIGGRVVVVEVVVVVVVEVEVVVVTVMVVVVVEVVVVVVVVVVEVVVVVVVEGMGVLSVTGSPTKPNPRLQVIAATCPELLTAPVSFMMELVGMVGNPWVQ